MNEQEFTFFEVLDWPIIIFMMLFSLGLAIFYTLIFSSLFNIKYKPSWLFFALLPSLILLTALLYRPAVLLVFFILAGMIFVLAFIGMITASIRESLKNLKEKRRITKTKKPLWLEILKIIGGLILGVLLMGTGPYAFFIIIFIIIFMKLVSRQSQDRFLNLQATLPTSKIRSMAMGLVEVKGIAVMTEPLFSKIGKTECIGYTYRVESISTDKDGKDSYRTILFETECNPFQITDDSGSVTVLPTDLDMFDLTPDKSYRSSGKRYTSEVLLDQTEILLIGKASLKDQKTVLEKETIKNIFALSPVAAVHRWNKFAPLRKSAITFAAVSAILVALILTAKFEYTDNIVSIRFIFGKELFSNLNPF
ncbi:MAG: hypothetical protein ACTIJ9_11180 [Aequorivita sp.]